MTTPNEAAVREVRCRYGHTKHFVGCEDCPYVHGAHSVIPSSVSDASSEVARLRKALLAARQWMNDYPPIGTPGTITAMRAIDAALRATPTDDQSEGER